MRSSSGRARRVDADWLAPTATVPPARRAALGALPSAPLAAATHSSMMRSSASRTTHARRDALSILEARVSALRRSSACSVCSGQRRLPRSICAVSRYVW